MLVDSAGEHVYTISTSKVISPSTFSLFLVHWPSNWIAAFSFRPFSFFPDLFLTHSDIYFFLSPILLLLPVRLFHRVTIHRRSNLLWCACNCLSRLRGLSRSFIRRHTGPRSLSANIHFSPPAFLFPPPSVKKRVEKNKITRTPKVCLKDWLDLISWFFFFSGRTKPWPFFREKKNDFDQVYLWCFCPIRGLTHPSHGHDIQYKAGPDGELKKTGQDNQTVGKSDGDCRNDESNSKDKDETDRQKMKGKGDTGQFNQRLACWTRLRK